MSPLHGDCELSTNPDPATSVSHELGRPLAERRARSLLSDRERAQGEGHGA